MTREEHAEAALRRVHLLIKLLNQEAITPVETAENVLDSLAQWQAYEIVHQVAEILPLAVHDRLKISVDEILKPGCRPRTFNGLCFSTEEEKAEYDRQIHSQFVHVAESLREYWKKPCESS